MIKNIIFSMLSVIVELIMTIIVYISNFLPQKKVKPESLVIVGDEYKYLGYYSNDNPFKKESYRHLVVIRKVLNGWVLYDFLPQEMFANQSMKIDTFLKLYKK